MASRLAHDHLAAAVVLLGLLDRPASPQGRVGGAARELALDMNAIALRSRMPEDARASDLEAWSRLAEIIATAVGL